MGNLTGKKVLMVLAAKDFRDEEFFKTRVALQANGAVIVNTSKDVEEATGTMGGKARIDLPLNEVKVDDYEAIVFVGGSGAAGYFKNRKVLNIARLAVEKNKVVGAICIAPSILANAGVLKDKKATSFSSEKKNLISQGASFIGSNVVADGNIVTASGPESADAFGKRLAKVLAK